MEVYLEGTAGPEGWPAPGCGCASCGRLSPGHRRPTSILIDGLVRLSPETATSGEVTTGISQGQGGYDVRRGPDGVEIIAPDRTRLLYAFASPGRQAGPHDPRPHDTQPPDTQPPDTGPNDTQPPDTGRHDNRSDDTAPGGHAPGAYDMVLIDLLDRPDRLGLLRLRGQVTPHTQVIVVGVDHRVSSEIELGRRLAFWQARAVPDGTLLKAAAGPRVSAAPAGRRPRRTLLLGGSRSGKSAEAEMRVAADPDVIYVATGPSGGDDPSWLARVKTHQERRPAHWRTVETTDLGPLLAEPRGTLLIDGLGTWLAAVFDESGAWPGQPGAAQADSAGSSAADLVTRRCDDLVKAWRRTPGTVVAVSDEVGLGVIPATASGRLFRDALGRLNQRLAQESEDVALVVAGRPIPLPY